MGTTGAPTGGHIIRTDENINDKRTKARGSDQGPGAACKPSSGIQGSRQHPRGWAESRAQPDFLGHSRWHSSSRPQQVLGGQQPQSKWGRAPDVAETPRDAHSLQSPRSSPLCGTRLPCGVPAHAWQCLHNRLWGRHGVTPILQLGKLRPREAESSWSHASGRAE